jgi:hypothetical protein
MDDPESLLDAFERAGKREADQEASEHIRDLIKEDQQMRLAYLLGGLDAMTDSRAKMKVLVDKYKRRDGDKL